MNSIDGIISAYIQKFGTEEERQMDQIYSGNYQKIFSGKESAVEESLGFSGGEVAIFAILVYILEAVGKAVIKDGYELSKKLILKYIKRDKTALGKGANAEKIEVSKETIENLILLLETELAKHPGETKETETDEILEETKNETAVEE